MKPLQWKRDAGYHYLHFTAKLPNGGYFVVACCHGGGWCALEYGPRGATKAAQDFWEPPDRAGQARAWCAARYKRRRQTTEKK